MSQAEKACAQIQNNKFYNSVDVINAVGVSQGGLIARYLVEDCDVSAVSKREPGTSVNKLLTVGTPNMGVSEIPMAGCQSLDASQANILCHIEKNMLDDMAFKPFVQESVSPAGYYRNAEHLDAYKKGSTFLAKLNNEVGEGTPTFEK